MDDAQIDSPTPNTVVNAAKHATQAKHAKQERANPFVLPPNRYATTVVSTYKQTANIVEHVARPVQQEKFAFQVHVALHVAKDWPLATEVAPTFRTTLLIVEHAESHVLPVRSAFQEYVFQSAPLNKPTVGVPVIPYQAAYLIAVLAGKPAPLAISVERVCAKKHGPFPQEQAHLTVEKG